MTYSAFSEPDLLLFLEMCKEGIEKSERRLAQSVDKELAALQHGRIRNRYLGLQAEIMEEMGKRHQASTSDVELPSARAANEGMS